MSLRPLGDRVLIRRVESSSKTPGGIYIPDSAQEKQTEGIVLSAGPGKVHEDGVFREVTVKTGDRVLIGKYAGSEMKIDGVEHLVLREDDILAVIE